MAIAVVSAIATVILPISAVATGISIFLIGQVFTSLGWSNKRIQLQDAVQREGKRGQAASSVTHDSNCYREMELHQVVTALKANSSVVVVGEKGSGKSTLGTAVFKQLSEEGFTITFVEPATPKQMLVGIAKQLGIDTRTQEGRVLTVEGLKRVIATFFENNTAFLVVDDAHACEHKFKVWLNTLAPKGVPMLILASNSDIFTNLPCVELAALEA